MKQKGLKFSACLLSALILSVDAVPCMAAMVKEQRQEARKVEKLRTDQWKGKKVAFLGDSITDKHHIGTRKNYWQYLEEMLGLKAFVYGINGHHWDGIYGQAQRLKEEMGDEVDAIVIFAGTNDYGAGVPLGEWYDLRQDSVTVGGPTRVMRTKREMQTNTSNFRGRINRAMAYMKENFPKQQIIIMTPIHRAFAQFGNRHILPDESYPNALGLYLDDYVAVLKEAAGVWAVPMIDLNSVSGLYPRTEAHVQYFHSGKTDKVHPNAEGHYRMALSIAYQMQFYPSDFK